jgi:hypothetical protein
MVQRLAKYRPARMNMYVPACAYSVDVVHEGPYEVRFGPMALANATKFLSAQSIAAAVDTTTLLVYNTDPLTTVAATDREFPYGPGYGRNLQVVASGAATSNVTVYGRDYLGQPMAESFTLNGTTPVLGVKAFKWVDRITAGITAAVTINVGTGAKLGLPYKMQNVLEEMLDNVRVSTLGTLATPVLTDPQTTTTGDPRGTYIPNSTLNGTAFLSAVFQPSFGVNASGNGGLHGIQHVAS